MTRALCILSIFDVSNAAKRQSFHRWEHGWPRIDWITKSSHKLTRPQAPTERHSYKWHVEESCDKISEKSRKIHLQWHRSVRGFGNWLELFDMAILLNGVKEGQRIDFYWIHLNYRLFVGIIGEFWSYSPKMV